MTDQSAEYALPEITDVVFDQWYESAKADADAGNPWSTNPLAIMAVVDELRRRRKERLLADEGYDRIFRWCEMTEHNAEYGASFAKQTISEVRLRLADYFAELDDSPDGPFGELPRVVLNNDQWATLYVHHESEPFRVKISLTFEDTEPAQNDCSGVPE